MSCRVQDSICLVLYNSPNLQSLLHPTRVQPCGRDYFPSFPLKIAKNVLSEKININHRSFLNLVHSDYYSRRDRHTLNLQQLKAHRGKLITDEKSIGDSNLPQQV